MNINGSSMPSRIETSVVVCGDVQTRVYQYGLLPPVESAERVRQQLSAAHAYRNVLTQIARGQRDAERAAIESIDGVQEAAHVARDATRAVAAAHDAIRAEHSERRERNHLSARQRELDDARAHQSEAYRALDTARRSAARDPGVRAQMVAIRDLAHDLRINARSHCECYWGTYQLVEAAADQALRRVLAPGRSIALPLWDGVDPCDPRFRRWNGEGAVSVQVMGGASPTDADDTRWRIETREEEYTVKQTGQRRTRTRHTLALRVGSEGRSPIWARWPLILHRPLPDGATIMRITATVRREGPHDRWTAEVTVRLPAPLSAARDDAGAIAIDLGWRAIGSDIRVASWVDEHGVTGELRLSAHLIGSLRRASEIASVRADNFNLARDVLRTHLGAIAELPPWLAERTRTLADWRSPARLGALARSWRNQRFEGDAPAYEALERWRYHDWHLWEWETANRPQALRARRELYRRTSFAFARRYSTLILEQFDLRRVARHATVDSTDNENATARGNRQLVAPSELRSCLVNAIGRTGSVIEVDPADTTHICHACSALEVFDAAENLFHTCGSCGARWDQDENAARILLRRGREQSGDAPSGAIARSEKSQAKQGSRWSRARAAKAERLAAIDRSHEASQQAETS